MRIAIASGKGGTGKTFVSTNLFWVAQQAGISVTLTDCDAEEPNVREFIDGQETDRQTVTQHIPVIDTDKCIFCGKCFDYCSYHAIVYLPMASFIKAVHELCHDCGACSLMCETGAITEEIKPLGTITTWQVSPQAKMVELCAEVGVYTPVPIIKKALKNQIETGLSIYDSPPGISCSLIATVDQSDYVVLVTEPTPFGLNDLKLTIETIQEMHKPFGVIVNRAGLGDNELYQWLKQHNIPILMEIPFDREIARIYSEGRILSSENDSYRKQFSDLLSTLTGAELAKTNTPA